MYIQLLVASDLHVFDLIRGILCISIKAVIMNRVCDDRTMPLSLYCGSVRTLPIYTTIHLYMYILRQICH